MRRLLPGLKITCFLFLVFSFFSFAYAQEFDFNRALSDYLFNFNSYRSAHLDYTSTKSEYLTYKTLTAQTKALEAGKTMLVARDSTLVAYLTALRMKLKETTGILNYQQNLSYLKLDNEVTWLNTHKTSLPSAASLEDLVKTSQELEKRFPEQETLAYQTLGQIIFGKMNGKREEIQKQIAETETKINQIKKAGEDITVLERWLIQAKEKIKRSEEKEKEAQNLLSQMKAGDTDKIATWNKTQKLIEEENQYLKETVAFLKETVREIKSAQ